MVSRAYAEQAGLVAIEPAHAPRGVGQFVGQVDFVFGDGHVLTALCIDVLLVLLISSPWTKALPPLRLCLQAFLLE